MEFSFKFRSINFVDLLECKSHAPNNTEGRLRGSQETMDPVLEKNGQVGGEGNAKVWKLSNLFEEWESLAEGSSLD